MSLHDSLAEQRTAIFNVLEQTDIGTVYIGPVDDPVPPSLVINDPELIQTQGTMFIAIWRTTLFKVRADPLATSVAFDADIPKVLKALLTINGCVPQGVSQQSSTESGYALPTAVVTAQLPFSLC